MNGKVVIVTGGNTGIGYATAKGLAEQGAYVIITTRTVEKGIKAVASLKEETKSTKIDFIELNLDSFKSVRSFVNTFLAKKLPLHVLVNNAGVSPGIYDKTLGKITNTWTLTEDGNEITFQSNHLGHFLLTILLLDVLIRSSPSRIVNVSSSAHTYAPPLNLKSFSDKTNYDPFTTYSNTKLANVLFTVELQRRLENKGISDVYVNSLHPGVVQTDIIIRNNPDFDVKKWIDELYPINAPPLLSPTEGATASLFAATNPAIETENIKGKYFDADATIKETAPQASDQQLQKELWKLSEELTGVVSPY